MAHGVQSGANLKMADALWEGHTLLKTGLSAHRHTKVKTVYPPVSLRSLGGYNNSKIFRDENKCVEIHGESRISQNTTDITDNVTTPRHHVTFSR